MSFLLYALAALFLGLFWYLRFVAMGRLLRWLGATPLPAEPFWRSVGARVEQAARRQRMPVPQLWVLPEFSPNALILRAPGGRLHLALTEGFARVLSVEEMDAALALCLVTGRRRQRGRQTWLVLLLSPAAEALRAYPSLAQVLLSPIFSALARLAGGPRGVSAADTEAAKSVSPWVICASLQKLSVAGRKLPLRRWTIALDPLFLLSPLVLDNGPQWAMLSQPSVEERRRALLGEGGESAPAL